MRAVAAEETSTESNHEVDPITESRQEAETSIESNHEVDPITESRQEAETSIESNAESEAIDWPIFVDGKAHDADDSTSIFNKALRYQIWERDGTSGSLFTGVAFSRVDADARESYLQEALEHGGIVRDAPSQVSRPRVHQYRGGPPQDE